MKNVHLITKQEEGVDVLHQYLYITSEEDIGAGDWYYLPRTKSVHKCIEEPTELNLERRLGVAKIILTDDPDLIAEGVQAIDNEFLEWFVNNPSCEEVEVGYGWIRLTETNNEGYWVSIPNNQFEMQQEEPKQDLEKEMFDLEQELDIPSSFRWHNSKPKQETLEEVALRLYPDKGYEDELYCDIGEYNREFFIEGAKWQQEQDRWKTVCEETPPIHVELLVKSPEGIVHLSSWRESYNIFSCQAKLESSLNWKWKTI